MWTDLANTIYIQGKCDSVTYNGLDDDTIKQIVDYWIGYKVVNVIPTLFFSCYLAINLSYRSIVTLFEKKHQKCMIDDDYEVFYSHSDILYVLDLLNNKQRKDENLKEFEKDLKVFTKIFNNLYRPNASTVADESDEEEEMKKLSFFKKHIYNWQDTFKFTSRFVNTHIVAYLALYHFSMFILFYLVWLVLYLQQHLNYLNFDNLSNVTIGQLTCLLGPEFCLEGLDIPLPIPKTFVIFGPSFIPSINALFIVPLFGALLICVFQIFFGIRDSKKHLIQIYKGKCTYLPPIRKLANATIAGSSFHYGGYLTGYLIWGFMIQYMFIVLIGLLIIIMRTSIGDQIFLNIFLKIIPVITIILVKQVVNVVAARFVFLRRDTKILALDNFRAFNVFLYFNFFFDCFTGIISAVIRVFKTVIVCILMMPRIAYGFFGRLLERKDNGYSAYMGFMYMEAGKYFCSTSPLSRTRAWCHS